MSKRFREFKCVNDPNDFCNVCGEYIKKKKLRKFTDALQESYRNYFGTLPNLTDPWTPKSLCAICQSILSKWAVGHRYEFVFFLYMYICINSRVFSP